MAAWRQQGKRFDAINAVIMETDPLFGNVVLGMRAERQVAKKYLARSDGKVTTTTVGFLDLEAAKPGLCVELATRAGEDQVKNYNVWTEENID